jgi:ribosomal protein S18 acetylase RimI-like enzyme
MSSAPSDAGPDGVILRAAAITDVSVLADLGRRIGAAIGDEPVLTASDLSADLTRPDLDPAVDTQVAIDSGTGSVVGYALARDELVGRGGIEPFIDPELPATMQDQLLDGFLAWGIERMCVFGERRALASTVAVASAARSETRMFAAFSRFGFAHQRTFWRMGLRLDQPFPRPQGVDGIVVERVDPRTEESLARLHALDTAAFADHWGFVPQTFAEFSVDLRAFAGLDPRGTWIARDAATGDDAGFLIGSDRALEQRNGYVDVLGVLEPFRGRGVARELLATSFAYYAERGLAGVQLGVDAGNTTGATRLYESVGMVAEQTWDVWELTLTLDAEEDSAEGD